MSQLSLAPILPWLNGDPVPPARLRHNLSAFLRSFNGTATAGYLQVYAEAGEAELHGSPPLPQVTTPRRGFEYTPESPVSPAALARLRGRVLALVRKGFPYDKRRLEQTPGFWLHPERGDRVDRLPSLRFGLKRNAPEAQRLGRAARRRYRSEPGSYVLLVAGELRDLVPYLVARLLTLPGGAAIARCAGPAKGQRGDKRCERLFLLSRVGRPGKFCSNACKTRQFAADNYKRTAWEEK